MSEIADLYNENYHNNFKNVVEENKQLKAENEFKESQINDWIKQYKLAHQRYMKLQTENEKYKQCLDEIKGICEQYGENGIELSVEKQEQILQLIKQTLGDTHGLYSN